MMKMQRMFGGQTLNVINPRTEIGETEQEFLDQAPADYAYDFVILHNSDKLMLRFTAKRFVGEELS
ncbi:MAG: hypothetical protein PF495_15150 [Spirochaetales bacterium]|nr:hypothetical protein [Spirochaetales bacterium]